MMPELLIQEAIFQIEKEGLPARYLLPHEASPMKKKNICGSWLLVFSQADHCRRWLEIYGAFKTYAHTNPDLRNVVAFEPIEQIDSRSICLNRGFNEAYTTSHYAEYLECGGCKPNEWIVAHLAQLKHALDIRFEYLFQTISQRRVIEQLMHKSFKEPNSQLKWTSEPFPWTLYVPPIELADVQAWN